jgi:predicted AlkP superfamily pyrophosphatase or phosphodiesterase
MGSKIRRPGGAFLAPVVLGLAVLAGTCSPGASPPSPPPVRSDSALVRGAVTDHVIVISMDGFRPDAIARIRPRTIGRLVREGSHTLEARTIVPSRTLPWHMSMVSGEPPDVHGVVNNEDPDETRWIVDVPTIFHLARERGFHTAAFFSKTKFRQIHEPGSVVHTEKPGNPLGLRPSWSTAGKVERYLARERPQLVFIHFAEPDYVGHVFGWMSPPYRWAVGWTDRALTRVLAAADRAYGAGNYTVILTADHGGSRFSHGSDSAVDMTIPWIAWGKGVRGGVVLPAGIRTMDTAATAMWLLGIPRPGDWVGSPVVAAFDAGASPRD